MNALHDDIAAAIEGVNTKTTVDASSVPGKTQPLAELTSVQLEFVGGGGVSNSWY